MGGLRENEKEYKMTDETRSAVEAEAYASYRREAVGCMRAMGVPDVDDSWEGMMKAVEYVKDHADREGEFSGAVMAAAKWMHGYLEQDTAHRLKKAGEMVSRETGSADSAKEGHAETSGARAANVSASSSLAHRTLPRTQPAGAVPARDGAEQGNRGEIR